MPKYKLTPVATLIMSASILTGCQTEKSDDQYSYVLPTAGFSSSAMSVSENDAGTIFIRVNVDLPANYKETYLAENDSDDDFTMSLNISATGSSTAELSSDYDIGDVYFSGDLDAPYFLIPMTIINDDEAENLEVVTLQISSEDVNPSSTYSNRLAITITDSDIAKTISFSPRSIVAKEGDIVDLAVNLSVPSKTPIEVPISLGGTADIGTDYTMESPVYLESGQPYDISYTLDDTALSLIIRIPANVSEVSIPLSMITDGLGENTEYISVEVTDGGTYSVSEGGIARISLIGNFSPNDTGVTLFSDGSSIQTLADEPADYPNQDAGEGTNAFSVVYRDLNGNEVPNATSSSLATDSDIIRCSDDSVTGLMWINNAPMPDSDSNGTSDTLEQTISYINSSDGQPASSLVDNGHYLTPSDLVDFEKNTLFSNLRYFYQDSDTSRNGSVSGKSDLTVLYTSSSVDSITSQDGVSNLSVSEYCLPRYSDNEDTTNTDCGTEALLGHLNSVGMCGRTNWRLPTYSELYTTIDFGEGRSAFSTFSNAVDDYSVLTRTTAPTAASSVLCLNTSGETRLCNKLVPAVVMPVSDDL